MLAPVVQSQQQKGESMKLVKRYSRLKFENNEKSLPEKCSFLEDKNYAAINKYKNNSGKTVYRVEFLRNHARALIESASREPRLLMELEETKIGYGRLLKQLDEMAEAHGKMAETIVTLNEAIMKRDGVDPNKKKKTPFKDSTTRLAEAGTQVRSPGIQGGLPSHGKRT